MIFLHKPYIKKSDKKARLIFDLEINNEKKRVWYEVEEEYEKYLCDDRVDPILVGMLSYAMRNGHDIKSDSYVTDQILYQIQETLIPVLSQHAKSLKNINVDIKPKKPTQSADKVGTGCSGGVDSLYAITRHINYRNPDFNIDYLCINNVGSFNECYEEAGIDKVRKERIKKSKQLAKDINIPLIVTDSNFYQEIPQNHLLTCTYSSVFAILCLEKLWGKYYYGSVGLDYTHFHIKDNDISPASHYDLLSLDCFSYNGLKIYSDGGGINRFDKLKRIYQTDLYKKYVHVCTTREYNCGKCPKCRRELLSLYLLNVNLDDYKNVFDVKYFKDHLEEYFQWIYDDHIYYLYHNGHSTNENVYNKLLEKTEFQEFLEKQPLNAEPKTKEALQKDVDWLYAELENIKKSRVYRLTNKVYKTNLYNNIKKVRVKRIEKKNENKMFEKMIKEYAKEINIPLNELKNDIKQCKRRFKISVEDYINFDFDKLNDSQRSTYLTNGYMENFVKKFNDTKDLQKFKNKVEFDTIFKDYIKRDFCSTKDLTLKQLQKFMKDKDKIVYKPLDLALGEGFTIFDCHNDVKDIYREIKEKKDGIIEDYIVQHPDLEKISPSVNTLRIVIFNTGKECKVLTACLRMGVNKMVDNFCAGGIAAGIDIKTGKVNTTGIDKKKNRYKEHPVSKVKLEGFKIPYWKEVIDLVKQCYNLIPTVRYIGFDVAIKKDGPVIVEGNASLPDYMIMQCVSEERKGLKPELDKILEKYSK